MWCNEFPVVQTVRGLMLAKKKFRAVGLGTVGSNRVADSLSEKTRNKIAP